MRSEITIKNAIIIEPPSITICGKLTPINTLIANLANAKDFISAARKASEFSGHNAELADQADAILQAIIDNLKAERIPAEASYHLSNAQNEINACKSLLAGDAQLSDAVFSISESLARVRKGEL
jgi:hypothetical protein